VGRDTTLDKARADGYTAASSREQFFADSDVVSLHVRFDRRHAGHGHGG
jgi:D-3-phosphoglycerate dehydrogenase